MSSHTLHPASSNVAIGALTIAYYFASMIMPMTIVLPVTMVTRLSSVLTKPESPLALLVDSASPAHLGPALHDTRQLYHAHRDRERQVGNEEPSLSTVCL